MNKLLALLKILMVSSESCSGFAQGLQNAHLALSSWARCRDAGLPKSEMSCL